MKTIIIIIIKSNYFLKWKCIRIYKKISLLLKKRGFTMSCISSSEEMHDSLKSYLNYFSWDFLALFKGSERRWLLYAYDYLIYSWYQIIMCPIISDRVYWL